MTVVPLAIAVDLRYRRWRHQFSLFISHDPWFRPMVIQAAGKYPNLAEYYQKNATKFWDNFYKRHKNKFFKDRHYLEKDWGQYFSDDANSANVKVLLEVGCGAGNTIFPLIAAYPELYVQACDISPHAVALVKPDGYVLLRDYAIGDFAQVKLGNKNQMISEGFYVRGDGTCSFYFSEDFLSTLFFQAGFNTVDISTYCKQIKNSHKNITMDRKR
ncbi:hypothetical protein E1A91_A05G440900v1 [Gossypium mustelinum]|uniref:Methyltransferase type 12 domain-containing protein n=1 Tax=Gossypium mustelinum TaxID=34275 RepID=A0A5D2ZID6_GOSMU|nr:hypothetical protein E1A91_A05G440900v1 [Gossypium mustelinum]